MTELIARFALTISQRRWGVGNFLSLRLFLSLCSPVCFHPFGLSFALSGTATGTFGYWDRSRCRLWILWRTSCALGWRSESLNCAIQFVAFCDQQSENV